jgi:hypothetical protein
MQPKKSAIARKLPTFTQLRRYLDGLGFTYRIDDDEGRPVHVYKHQASGCLFVFPDYPANKPVPNHVAQPVHFHLTWRGLIDDMTYDQFLDLFATAKAG